MSIQSNINNTIGQAAILASLNPAVQEMGETAKDKSKLKSVEKQLDVLKEKADKDNVLMPEADGQGARLATRFPLERDAEQYNKLRETHNELAGKLAGRGYNIDKVYLEGTSQLADLHRRAAKTLKIRKEAQKAEEQRKKVEEIQKQKEAEAKAAQEFRSKQIRDLIMNPNLEVNNGTGNDTRR